MLQDGVKGKAFFFDDNNRGVLGDGIGDYERTQSFSIDLSVLPTQIYEDATVFNHREDNNTGNAGYQLQLDNNRLQFDLQHSRAGNMIRVVSREPLPLKQWSRVSVTYDGSSRASGVALYVNGARVEADVVSDNLTRTIKPNGGGLFGGEWLGIMFGRRFRFTPMKDGAIDEFRVFNRALTPLEVKFLDEEVGRPAPQPFSAAEVEAVLVATDSRVVAAAEELSAARTEHNQIVSVVPQVHRARHQAQGGAPFRAHRRVPPDRGQLQGKPYRDGHPPHRLVRRGRGSAGRQGFGCSATPRGRWRRLDLFRRQVQRDLLREQEQGGRVPLDQLPVVG